MNNHNLHYPILITGNDYYPNGPQTNVAWTTITNGGWELCYSSSYSSPLNANALSSIMNSRCTKSNVLLGCRLVNSPNTIITLAWAPRDCVFTKTTGTRGSATTTCEGTEWYYNNAYSWGFAKAGDGVNKATCDTATSGCNDCRLCLHTQGSGGWRCGSTTELHDDNSYEKVIFQKGKK